jgi:hypothetical protein
MRPPSKRLLSLDPQWGSVYAAARPEEIHVRLGPVHLVTSLEGLRRLRDLVSRATLNWDHLTAPKAKRKAAA